MKRSYRATVLASLGAFAIATPLLATPADQVKSRIASYRELGAAFKNVNDALRGPTPPVMILQISSRTIQNMARAQYTLFPAGTGAEAGVKTKAKPEIWSQAARFRAAQDAFAAQAGAFDRAVRSGNMDAVRAETRKLGGTCKGCHDQFRLADD
jgi:cytochrome c556